MEPAVRWGILGCGRIAGKFASDLQIAGGGLLKAVASRQQATAEAFGKEVGAPFRLGSYEALVTHKEVDIIYVASPHGLHYEHVKLCLEAGKAVLCEKAFALNQSQAQEMIELAKRKNVFLMEALWTKFLPHYQTLMYMLRSGQLGAIRSILVHFGFKPSDPIPDRLFNPELGGGSLLDIGIYNVFLCLSVLGRPDEIEAWMTPAPTGVDEQCAVIFRYRSGAIAQLFSTFSSNLATEADINGDLARIRLTSRFYEPSTTIEHYPGRVESRQIIPVEREAGWGYQYQIRHVQECLRKEMTESPVMSFADTLLLMETLDRIREKAGIRYSADLRFSGK